MKKYFGVVLSLVLALAITSCGSSGGSSSGCESTASAGVDRNSSQVACTGSHKIEYTPTSTPTVGKSTFTLAITNISDGSAYTGRAITELATGGLTVKPWMVMDAHEHGAVMSSLVNNGDGTYDGVVHYLMASSMNGMSMGTWELQITVAGETTKVYPDVMMSMSDTTMVKLSNDNDTISMMGMAQTRTYYLFKDSVSSSMFSIVVAARESMMNHPTVSTGTTLTDANGASWTVSSMSLQASTDNSTWVGMMDKGNGSWSVMGLGLTDGVAGTVYVKMTINGLDYGTATFSVTPGGGMSM